MGTVGLERECACAERILSDWTRSRMRMRAHTRVRVRTRNLDFRKNDVMHARNNDVNYMPVASEAGTPICGPFLTTNGCIDVYDLKGKLR